MEKIEGVLFSDNKKVLIEIENGIISKIERSENSLTNGNVEYVAPAFIDNQVNGYIGIEFSDENLSVDDMVKIVRMHKENGVTTFLPTIITSSYKSLVSSFKNLVATLKNKEVAYAVPGFHLEGPYISPVAGYRGAHRLKDIRKPDWDEFQKINEVAEGKIIQITVAPEVEGAIEFIKKCVQNNIIVSLGHHNGNSEDIKRAVDAGAKTVTHLGNGLANNINRFNNPLWMQLAEDRLMCSMIMDGFHIKPEMAKVFYRTKGSRRIILTSDMTMLAGMPPGHYTWDGNKVVLTEEGIIIFPKENVFAGASLPLITGVKNIMKFTGCTLKEAIDMVTINPARLYGFTDRGEIAVGKRADIVVFDMKNNKINIKKTIMGFSEKEVFIK